MILPGCNHAVTIIFLNSLNKSPINIIQFNIDTEENKTDCYQASSSNIKFRNIYVFPYLMFAQLLYWISLGITLWPFNPWENKIKYYSYLSKFSFFVQGFSKHMGSTGLPQAWSSFIKGRLWWLYMGEWTEPSRLSPSVSSIFN